jgi:hypothetical protein
MESNGANREVLANMTDIISNQRHEKVLFLMDVALPSDGNVIEKETKKKLKYKNLSIKIQRMWNMKFIAMSVTLRQRQL